MALALMSVGAGAAWEWQANSYGKVIARNETNHQADLEKIAAAAADQSRQALAKQQSDEQALAALDQKATEEKTNALAENGKLRRAIADGSRRLRVAGSCSANGGNVSGTSIATGVGDAGAVELSQAAGSDILSIRAGIIADQAALRALQTYVMNVCQ
ncbi:MULTISPECIES: lysis system i-spanin subunit Rz [unclassified Pseudomonas]|nr:MULTISPECIES: lysis system i-spanin subunit Rz [unclassified Pseudomonas]MEA9997036.1 lysis system i-spanin subunit Rz [Pseudomonas sp. AA4]MEB0089226.1 lysis system i-spanin subunit Rz [Pseudomonas sp. RTI1]MEB0128418.1 lysis system i-spanin subunit Rz [Pseudomonas sp. CCC1.2]